MQCTNDNLWAASVFISYTTKQPITVYLYSAQKQKGEYERAVADCKPITYLGPTPLSTLVTQKAANVRQELERLFDSEESGDGGAWATVWNLVPNDYVAQARCLIVTLLLRAIAGWTARVIERADAFPLLFLKVVQDPPSTESASRKALAYRLLHVCEEKDLSNRWGDAPAKMAKLFRREWDIMERTGACPIRLYCFLLVFRQRLPHDTQDIEGANSVLQRMADVAPNLRIRLASDRLRIKLGNAITTDECLSLHAAVLEYMRTDDNIVRFGDDAETPTARPPLHRALAGSLAADTAAPAVGPPLPPPASPPTPPRHPPPPPAPPEDAQLKLAAGYAAGVGEWMPEFMDSAFSLEDPNDGVRKAFLMCWSYNRKVMCATAKISSVGGGRYLFQLDYPICLRKLVYVVRDAFSAGYGPEHRPAPKPKGRGRPPKHTPIILWQGKLQWTSLLRAVYSDEDALDIKRRAPPKPPKAKADTPQDDDPGGGDDGPDEDDANVLLEHMLEEVLEGEGEYSGESGDELAGHPEEEVLDEHGVAEGEVPPEDVPPDGHLDGHSDAPPPGDVLSAPGTPAMGSIGDETEILAARDANLARLETARSTAALRAGLPLDHGAVGLISTADGRCLFVRWTEAGSRMGRPIRVDGDDKLISMLLWAQLETDYSDATVIVGNTGLVAPFAVKKKDRPPIPEWLLTLRNHENCKRFCGPLAPTDLKGESCVRCRTYPDTALAATGGADPADMGYSYFRCTECMLLWHWACACRYNVDGDMGAFVCPCCAL